MQSYVLYTLWGSLFFPRPDRWNEVSPRTWAGNNFERQGPVEKRVEIDRVRTYPFSPPFSSFSSLSCSFHYVLSFSIDRRLPEIWILCSKNFLGKLLWSTQGFVTLPIILNPQRAILWLRRVSPLPSQPLQTGRFCGAKGSSSLWEMESKSNLTWGKAPPLWLAQYCGYPPPSPPPSCSGYQLRAVVSCSLLVGVGRGVI